jgi:hypothetical protein
MKFKCKIIIFFIMFSGLLNSQTCPEFEQLYANGVWYNMPEWVHLPSYIKGSNSGFNQALVNQIRDNYGTISCHYSDVESDSHQVYRKEESKIIQLIDVRMWTNLSPRSFQCVSDTIIDCSFD